MERYNKGLKMKDLFLKILNADCPHIYVENPTPMKLWQLPPHSQVIQPWQFSRGDEDYQKRTLLWLKGLPLLQVWNTVKPENVRSYVNIGICGKGNNGVAKNSKSRSKTFKGIARAIAEQYSSYLQGV